MTVTVIFKPLKLQSRANIYTIGPTVKLWNQDVKDRENKTSAKKSCSELVYSVVYAKSKG